MKYSVSTSAFLILSILFLSHHTKAQELDLKNSKLEKTNGKGGFFWWSHQAKGNGAANFSIERTDVAENSSKALRCEVETLGEKPWFVSSAFNSVFKIQPNEEITVSFAAKRGSEGTGKMGLVFQSSKKGSFQNKQFYLSEDWSVFTHTFTMDHSNEKGQLKFWYLEEGTTYFLDEVSVVKEVF